MGFNGIAGAANEPGEIPWEIVTAYFIIALAIAIYFGKKTGGLKAFTTLDLVYIGIGAAFADVWEFYIGSFLGKFVPSTPFVSISFWGRMIIVFIVAALVRKVGTGMLTLFIFDVLSDATHYGFGGEPMFFIYESLTYGLFVDLMIAATGGKLFGIGLTPKDNGGTSTKLGLATIIGVIEGAIVGFTWAIPDPIFYDGFFGPFIYAYAPNWAKIQFHLIAFIPGDVIIGIIAALLAMRVVKAVGA